MQRYRLYMVVVGLTSIMLLSACNSSPYALKFRELGDADKIEININRADRLEYVTDKAKIQRAAAFFEKYRDGWVSLPSGGGAPVFMRFLKNGEDLATFGVGPTFLTVGASTRYPDVADIEAMARGVGLQWPPPR